MTIEKKSSVELRDSSKNKVDRGSESRLDESPLGEKNAVLRNAAVYAKPMFSNVAEGSPYPNETMTSDMRRVTNYMGKM